MKFGAICSYYYAKEAWQVDLRLNLRNLIILRKVHFCQCSVILMNGEMLHRDKQLYLVTEECYVLKPKKIQKPVVCV